MNLNEYAKMADFEKKYWWHKGKLYLLKSLITKYFPARTDLTILEVGCGTGEVTQFLAQFGTVTGFDVSTEAIAFCKNSGVNNVFVADLTAADLSLQAKRYDLVVALDVLEHVQDDVLAMANVKKLLKDTGYFFVNVPAHKFLWSEHDEALHHKRRYHSLEITKKLKDAGFKIIKKSYFVTLVFPGIVFFRMWNNFFGKSAYPKTSYVVLPDMLNNLLIQILKLEANFVKNFSLPIGTTITVVATKDD